MDKDWKPIKTAPRDGTPIEVMADGIAAAVMRWNASYVGPLNEQPGCWVEVNGPCVWSEGQGCGPTHWRPVKVSKAVKKAMKLFESGLVRRRAYGPPSAH